MEIRKAWAWRVREGQLQGGDQVFYPWDRVRSGQCISVQQSGVGILQPQGLREGPIRLQQGYRIET